MRVTTDWAKLQEDAKAFNPWYGKNFKRDNAKRRKKKTRHAKKRLKELKRFGQKLNDKKFPSEVWFKKNWKKCSMLHIEDKFNEPFNMYIPDVLNERYKYIIEIDGKYHEDEKQKEKDLKRQHALEAFGYSVFRVRAFNYKDFGILVDTIKIRRKIFEARMVP